MWSTAECHKAFPISISSKGFTASRAIKAGHNPSVRASFPLSKAQPHFRIQVKRLGSWIAIGVSDLSFHIINSTTLGSQSNAINSCYFWQNIGIRKLQMVYEPSIEIKGIEEGDIVDVFVQFATGKIYYFSNGVLLGSIGGKKELISGTIFPTVSMSVGCSVKFLNALSVNYISIRFLSVISGHGLLPT